MVSKMIVSRFFNHAFPIRAGLCVPNLVPYDKFFPRNIEKAVEYLRALARIDPGRLKYADEKSLKGKDICNKLARRDPFTGIVPPKMADPDLRNTFFLWNMWYIKTINLSSVSNYRIDCRCRALCFGN